VLDWRPQPQTKGQSRFYGANYLHEPLTGLPCHEFSVVTHIDGSPATDGAIEQYKAKVGKSSDLRLRDFRKQFIEHTTGYSVELPPLTVEYNQRVNEINPFNRILFMASGERIEFDVLISTIPLPALLSLCKRPEPVGKLQSKPIYVVVEPRPVTDIMPPAVYVNYIADPATSVYRITDREDDRHAERLDPRGQQPATRIAPGKVYTNPRTSETLDWLQTYGILCVGRFARWEPDELAHVSFKTLKAWTRDGWFS